MPANDIARSRKCQILLPAPRVQHRAILSDRAVITRFPVLQAYLCVDKDNHH
ncbi:MAG: hypothetical protein SPL12_07465 [Bacteroidales bacterium]|nr:hypothetical protein [Bacteroidales bacterium]